MFVKQIAVRNPSYRKKLEAILQTINKIVCSRDYALFHDGDKNGVNLAILYASVVDTTGNLDIAIQSKALRKLYEKAHFITRGGISADNENQARVLIALIKEIVRLAPDDSLLARQSQLHYLYDFFEAATGSSLTIKRLLAKLALPELYSPDNVYQACDNRIYDNHSLGSKTAFHLLVKAYLKGLAVVTLAYTAFESPEYIRPIFESAKLLGIQTSIGVELLVEAPEGWFTYVMRFDSLKQYQQFYGSGQYQKIVALCGEKLFSPSTQELSAQLKKVPIDIVAPLQTGLAATYTHILHNYKKIQGVELWDNAYLAGEMSDERYTKLVKESQSLNEFRLALNAGDVACVTNLIVTQALVVDQRLVSVACHWYSKHPLQPRLSSAATGFDPHLPGMGFAVRAEIRNRSSLGKQRKSLPFAMHLVRQIDGRLQLQVLNALSNDTLLLGKDSYQVPLQQISLWQKLVTYRSPLIRNVMMMSAGVGASFAVNALFAAMGLPTLSFVLYPAWFAITYARCLIVEAVSRGVRNFDFRWASQTIAYGFIAIPLLKAVTWVVSSFLLPALPWALAPVVASTLLFVCVGLGEGVWVYFQNTLRGFDPQVKHLNFFRSLTGGSLAIGINMLLNMAGIFLDPVFLNKICNETVAANIEGISKYKSAVRTNVSFLENKLIPDSQDQSTAKYSLLQLFYVWRYLPAGKRALRKVLLSRSTSPDLFTRLHTLYFQKEAYVQEVVKTPHWLKNELFAQALQRYGHQFELWLARVYVRRIKKEK